MCFSIPIRIEANRIFSITIESDLDVDCLYLVSVRVQNPLLMRDIVFIYFSNFHIEFVKFFFNCLKLFNPRTTVSRVPNCSSRINFIYYLWELIFRKQTSSFNQNIHFNWSNKTICEKLSNKTLVSNKLKTPHKSCILTY